VSTSNRDAVARVLSATRIIGYADRLSVAPGETIAFMVSCDEVAAYRAEIVRLTCADPDPGGPGISYEIAAVPGGGSVPGRYQPVHPGSFGVVDRGPRLDPTVGFSVAAFVWPTLPRRGEQAILGRWSESDGSGYALFVSSDGSLALRVGDGSGPARTVATGVPLATRAWSWVGASFDARTGAVRVWQRALREHSGIAASAEVAAAARVSARWCAETPFLFAAWMRSGTGEPKPETVSAHFDGKIDRPVIASAVLDEETLRALSDTRAGDDPRIAARWDFAADIMDDRLGDVSGNECHGRTVHLPTRAVTGANWDGTVLDWRLAREQYGAIHFHHDDLYDCGWTADFEWAVPRDARSGFYAARLTADGVESWISFFVRPPRDRATARVALVASTATYLAYANTHIKVDSLNSETLFESVMPLAETEMYLNEHREIGYSLYDTHADGSGVVFSSWLRPILNMRPGLYTFNYVNDTYLTAWLERIGVPYDVITDEDVHREGQALLARYPVVITVSHPEYFTTPMWDAFDAYQRQGGRHMYLGGNGFYWRIAVSERYPAAIENRRGFTGVRTWESEPGEENLAFTGEPGGLWRCHGRAPQSLVGVGFSATIFNRSAWYRRTAASEDPRVAFMFEGIGLDERIGDFGRRGGGAAGLEIDRADPVLGTPPNALVVATSEDVGYGGLLSVEEFITTTRLLDGEQNARVRADMVFFETSRGGAVFSTGSIAWATSLAENGFDNNVARLTANVLTRFLDPAPFGSL
jgi:N,N-dimethylformamidase